MRGRDLGVAAAVAALASALWFAIDPAPAPEPPRRVVPIFRFGEDELVGFRIERDGEAWAFRRGPEGWEALGRPWRPDAALVRKVAHQMHALDGRVVGPADRPEDFGLGPRGPRIALELADGRTLRLEAGDPNPAETHRYVRVADDPRVLLVPRSAVDFLASDADALRERRVLAFDAREVHAVEASWAEGLVAIERDATGWRQVAPVARELPESAVWRLLGGLAALRSEALTGAFEPVATVRVTHGASERVLRIGAPSGDPPMRPVQVQGESVAHLVRPDPLAPFEALAPGPIDAVPDR